MSVASYSKDPLPPIGGKMMDSFASPFENVSPGSLLPSSTGKLNNVESQRIMAVILELQKKAQIIGMLPDSIDRKTSSMFSGEAMSLIKEHKNLECSMNALHQEHASIGDTKNSQDYLSSLPSSESKDFLGRLRESTKAVSRYFMMNANGFSKLKLLKSNTRTDAMSDFETLLEELRSIVYEHLRTSVEEEKLKQDHLANIITKEKKTSHEVRIIREELEKSRKERNQEVNKRNDTIRMLKEELRKIKNDADGNASKLECKSKEREDAEVQQFRSKETLLLGEIQELQTRLNQTIKDNRDDELMLRKKRFKIESEVENWIHKYDQDMDEKQVEIDEITTVYNEETAQLNELSAKYADLQAEWIIIETAMRAAKKKEDERLALQAKYSRCATRIQSTWRGYKTRKDLLKKSKKDKKGGSKGKGKGKK